jgi:hypothetical protein
MRWDIFRDTQGGEKPLFRGYCDTDRPDPTEMPRCLAPHAHALDALDLQRATASGVFIIRRARDANRSVRFHTDAHQQPKRRNRSENDGHDLIGLSR